MARLLTKAGHEVQLPESAELIGAEDPVHLTHAIRQNQALLTGNHSDFEDLHDLIMQAGGHHPGILVVRRENNPRRDLTPRGIVQAIDNLVGAELALRDQFIILNHWR